MEHQKTYQLGDFLALPESQKPFMAVLGHPVAHSRSPLIHNTALRHIEHDATYYAIDVPVDQRVRIPELVHNKNFCGANITLPLKGYIIKLLDKPSADVDATGACNTVWPCGAEGHLCGENTDIPGFIEPLKPHKETIQSGGVIVFGSGGAARAIVASLQSLGSMQIYVVTRNPGTQVKINGVTYLDYSNWIDVSSEVNLIVNCTPLGMHPNIETSPVAIHQVSHLAGKICYDIVYNPVNTMFLNQAKLFDAVIIDGTEMFIAQAARSFYHFTGKEFPVNLIRNVLFNE
jgi:shikimate dehydrogenase